MIIAEWKFQPKSEFLNVGDLLLLLRHLQTADGDAMCTFEGT